MFNGIGKMVPKQIRQWFTDQKNITSKTAGLAEKEASIKKKLGVAMGILNSNNRMQNIKVDFDRRKNGLNGNSSHV